MNNVNESLTSGSYTMFGREGIIPIPIEYSNQTIGNKLLNKYNEITIAFNIVEDAYRDIFEKTNEVIVSQAREIINIIENTINTQFIYKLGEINMPELQSFFPDDNSILLEIISSKYRVGFSLEEDKNKSSWYLVSTPDLGKIGASGLIMDQEKPKLISWLLEFVSSNS